jgi:predicted transcriptional regulator
MDELDEVFAAIKGKPTAQQFETLKAFLKLHPDFVADPRMQRFALDNSARMAAYAYAQERRK